MNMFRVRPWAQLIALCLSIVLAARSGSTTEAADPSQFLLQDCDLAFIIHSPQRALEAIERYADRVQPGVGLQIRSSLELTIATALGGPSWEGLDEEGFLVLGYDNARRLGDGPADWIVATVRDYEAFCRAVLGVGNEGTSVEKTATGALKVVRGDQVRFVQQRDALAFIAGDADRLQQLLERKDKAALSPAARAAIDDYAAVLWSNVPRLLERFAPEIQMMRTQLELGMQMALQQQQDGALNAEQVKAQMELVRSILDGINELGTAVLGVRADDEVLDVAVVVEPGREGAFKRFLASLRNGSVPEFTRLPEGATVYLGLTAEAEPIQKLFGGRLALGGGSGGVADVVAGRVQEQLGDIALRSAAGAFWMGTNVGLRAFSVIRTDQPQALVERIVQAWTEVNGEQKTKDTHYVDHILLQRDAFKHGSLVMHRILVKWDFERLEKQTENPLALGMMKHLLGESLSLYVGAVEGAVIQVQAVGDDSSGIKAALEQYLKNQNTLGQYATAQPLLQRLRGQYVLRMLMDLGGAVRGAIAAVFGVPGVQGAPSYTAIDIAVEDTVLTGRLLVPAAGLEEFVRTMMEISGEGEAEFVE